MRRRDFPEEGGDVRRIGTRRDRQIARERRARRVVGVGIKAEGACASWPGVLRRRIPSTLAMRGLRGCLDSVKRREWRRRMLTTNQKPSTMAHSHHPHRNLAAQKQDSDAYL